MAQQNVFLGSAPNDNTGDKKRIAGQKINANFTELYARSVDVREFAGADPTGTADSTAAFNAALATGRTVRAEGIFRITGPLSFTAARQWLLGEGARMVPVGNFNVLTTGAFEGCGVRGLYVDGSGMTGGNVFACLRSSRMSYLNCIVWSAWSVADVQESNHVTFDTMWFNNIRGSYVFRWYDNNTYAPGSDLLVLRNVQGGGNSTARPIGILWDGNCHTMQLQSVALVTCSRGIVAQNTSGHATGPNFLMAQDLSVDFPTGHAIELLDGTHFWFGPTLYLHGSTGGSGLYIGSGVQAETVGLCGGKITDMARYGIENAGRVMFCNAFMSGNDLGDFLNPGSVVCTSPRFEVDGTGYWSLNNGNPLFQYDSTDYRLFNRGTNSEGLTIDGIPVELTTASRKTFAVPVQFLGYTVAELPSANTATNATVRVTDRSHRLATSNGTDWLWAGDGAVVS